MILAALLSSIFSIYPWNIGGSVYNTTGTYSDGGSSISKAGYFSMDRRQKDGFVIGYEDLIIEKDDDTYRQFNWMGRDVFWIKPSLRLVGLVGHLSSSNNDDAWLGGVQAEGDLPWFGYSTGFIRSDYQFWIPYALLDAWENVIIDQYDFQFSKKWGPIITRIGMLNQIMGDDTYSMKQLTITGTIKEKISGSFSFSSGESLYAVDTYLLVINNNPEILTQSMSLRGTYKFTPNLYLSSIWTQQTYDPYTIQYVSVGVTGRF